MINQDVREDGLGNVYVNLNDGSGNPISSASGGVNVNIISNTSSSLGTAVITNVTQSITTGVLLATNANRKGFIIENNSTSICFVAFAATATTAAGGYTRRLQPNSAYEAPNWIYSGPISAIWAASGTGFAEITAL